VYADDGQAANYTLELHTYVCAMDCSDHGRCVQVRVDVAATGFSLRFKTTKHLGLGFNKICQRLCFEKTVEYSSEIVVIQMGKLPTFESWLLVLVLHHWISTNPLN
jgi:hypothetical protein